jgi:hypothetical protein
VAPRHMLLCTEVTQQAIAIAIAGHNVAVAQHRGTLLYAKTRSSAYLQAARAAV